MLKKTNDDWLPLLAACLLGLTIVAYLCTTLQLDYDDDETLTDISAMRR